MAVHITGSNAHDISAVGALVAPAPLTYAQERVWFFDRLAGPNTVYNIPMALRLRGTLAPALLERAVDDVIARHEILRSRFFMFEGRPVQQPLDAVRGILNRVDLPLENADVAEAAAHRLAVEETARPFNLESELPLRVTLVRLAVDHHWLLVTLSHIAADAWSMRVFADDLFRIYRGLVAGTPAPLPPLAMQYKDFAAAQRLHADAQARDHFEYWKERLAGAVPTELPLNAARPAVQTFRGRRYIRRWPVRLSDAVIRESRQQQASPFIGFLAAFTLFLFRYTQQRDLLLATSIAGRTTVDVEPLIGCFANTLLLRLECTDQSTYRDTVHATRQSAIQAYAHQDLPFEQIVEGLHLPRDLSVTPLFRVLFEFEYTDGGSFAFDGLTIGAIDLPNDTVKTDLALSARLGPAGVEWCFQYSTDLFDDETIVRLADHFETLCAEAVAAPTRSVSELLMLSPAETHDATVRWNGPVVDRPASCLHDAIDRQARLTPEAIAATDAAGSLTYAELRGRSNALARELIQMGAAAEQPVGVCLERSTDLLVALVAVLKTGAAFVPLDASQPRERLDYMLDDANVRLVVTKRPFASRLPDVALWLLDTPAVCEDDSDLRRRAAPGNLAYVIYTSGSTGRPKGVAIEHQALMNYLDWAVEAYRARSGDGSVVQSSISFDLTFTSLFVPLICGGTVRMLSELDPVGALADHLHRGAALSLIKITPAHLDLVTRVMPASDMAGCVHTMVIGGDALPIDNLAFWRTYAPTTRLINEYGPTETVVGCSTYDVTPATVRYPAFAPIGWPIDNTQLYVLDHAFQPLPVGVPGELFIGGAGVARGYFGRPELTAASFLPDPFSGGNGTRLYRTGDRVRRRGDGNIDFLGRLDNQVKLRGFRIELGEIESTLMRHPSVHEAVVIVRADSGGEALIAFFTCRSGCALSGVDARRYAQEQLPAYMVPASCVAVDAFTLTSNGKIDRRALPLAVEPALEKVGTKPRDATERGLVLIWEELFPGCAVGVTDNFFELGGHSFLAVRLMSRVQQEFAVDLPLSTLFRHATIEELATAVRGATLVGHQTPLVVVQRGGAQRPLFCVHSIGGHALRFQDLARRLSPARPVYALEAPPPADLTSSPSIEAMAADYIAAIKVQQERGPYALAGYSYGAVIAFEMARQLAEGGESVVPLIFLDGAAPGVYALPDVSDAAIAVGFARDMAHAHGVDLGLTSEQVEGMDPSVALNVVIARLHEAGIAARDLESDRVQRFFGGIRARVAALKGYTPRAYAGHATLIRSTGEDEDTAKAVGRIDGDVEDPSRGWAALCAGGCAIDIIDTHHTLLMNEPHVLDTALRVTACLEHEERRERLT